MDTRYHSKNQKTVSGKSRTTSKDRKLALAPVTEPKGSCVTNRHLPDTKPRVEKAKPKVLQLEASCTVVTVDAKTETNLVGYQTLVIILNLWKNVKER